MRFMQVSQKVVFYEDVINFFSKKRIENIKVLKSLCLRYNILKNW